jgi:hypothetical protein
MNITSLIFIAILIYLIFELLDAAERDSQYLSVLSLWDKLTVVVVPLICLGVVSIVLGFPPKPEIVLGVLSGVSVQHFYPGCIGSKH